jgi:hypothetical protein
MSKRKVGGKGSRKANTGRSYALALSPDVAIRMTGWGHTRRAIRNLARKQRQLLWEGRGIGVRANRQGSKTLADARRDFDWIEDFPAQGAQQALADLDRAYDNWWNPNHPAEAPTYEKRGNRLSFRLPGQAVDVGHNRT